MDKTAVLIPCYNEAVTIGKVVDDFKRVLPDADIYVYDNNSSDDTAEIAAAPGGRAIRPAIGRARDWPGAPCASVPGRRC